MQDLCGTDKRGIVYEGQNLLCVDEKSFNIFDPRSNDFQSSRDYKKPIPKFTCVSSTQNGNFSSGSTTSSVRLYTNPEQKNAKTNYIIPSGAEIIGVDNTKDGQWVLATCKECLYLIPTTLNNEAKNAFNKSMPADDRPKPIRLTLTNEDRCK